jgi:hypothetical protein
VAFYATAYVFSAVATVFAFCWIPSIFNTLL